MKKLLLIVFLAILIQVSLQSQTCLPNGIVFNTQVQVDSFQINYPDCNTIEGNVEITGANINNLSGLDVLIGIEGDLFIGYCTGLSNLAGFDNLTYIGQDLRIYMNTSILSLTGLDNISEIGQNLRITNNETLDDISALSNLTSVGSNLRVYGNTDLTTLTGFDNLVSVGDNLRITNNNALTSISALINVTSIDGELAIDNNDALESLEGINNISTESITDLVIRNNLMLSYCEVTSVCNYLSNPNGNISLHSNTINCNSIDEVTSLCALAITENISNKFSVFPNPANEKLNILNKHNLIISEVSIYNILGNRFIHKKNIVNPIDINMLSQGIYFVEIISGKSKTWEKLVIE